VSIDIEKATTRNLLDGMRSYLTTFQAQQKGLYDEGATLQSSREFRTSAVTFGAALPRLQHYSFVALLTMIVEARLTVFCRSLQEEHGFSPGIDGLSGDLLSRSRTFLSQNLDIDPPADLWRWLSDLARVRDCIVRTAGSVALLNHLDRREMTLITKRRPGIAVDTGHQLFSRTPRVTLQPELALQIDAGFCMEAVTAAQGLFGYLYQHRDPNPI
jgi:hypothetical protein